MSKLNNIHTKNYIFTALNKANISITDFSEITNISRTTLYNWKNDHNISDMIRLNLAYKHAVHITRAVHKGILPLKNKLKKSERIAEFKRIMLNMSHQN